jgi:hypothetical protein
MQKQHSVLLNQCFQPLIYTDNVQVQRRWYLIRINVTEKDCPAIIYALGCVCTVCNRYIFTCSQQRKMKKFSQYFQGDRMPINKSEELFFSFL